MNTSATHSSVKTSKTSKTWWGQNFIAALERFTESGRLSRGRAYRTDDRVKQWEINANTVAAKIRGNINPYFNVYKEPIYRTKLTLTPIDKKHWDPLLQAIGKNAGMICKLMLNEMPDEIEQPFAAAGLALLPTSYHDFQVSCSCPDHSVPCKHIAGVFYRLAEQLDHDPFLLFQLRGLSRQQLHQQLSQLPLGKALMQSFENQPPTPSAQDSYYCRPLVRKTTAPVQLNAYWQGDAAPANTNTSQLNGQANDQTPAIPALLIKKGGDYPPFWPRDNSFIEAMESYYVAIEKSGRKLLNG